MTIHETLLPNEMRNAGDKDFELLDEAVIAELDDLEGGVLGDLLALYFDESVGLMAQLATAVVLDEVLTISQTAHKLKGSSSAIGAGRVSNLAADLGASAQAGDLSVADDILDDLRHAIDDTRSAFDDRLP